MKKSATTRRTIYTKNPKGYIVRLSESAIISICLSAMEAYSVTHKGRKKTIKSKLETYGTLWGSSIKLVNGKRLYNIEMACVDTSAEIESDSCSYNDMAITLKRDVISSYWPHLEFLGDFHSHPYSDLSEVSSIKGYYFSEGDIDDLKDNQKFWKKHKYRVGLVITIASMGKASKKEPGWLNDKNKNTVIFSFGNYRLWITAYIVFKEDGTLKYSEDDADFVLLDCPALVGLRCEHTTFGRVTNGKVSKHEPGEI